MTNRAPDIDLRSFQLGMINCFAEMVAVGVKKLAISPPLTPAEYERLREASETIVRGSGIHSYLEVSLLITDLQSPDFTRGKWSILYFKDPAVLDSYQRLKEQKASMEAAGAYMSQERSEVSREFMRLLSYPEYVIAEKIKGGGVEDPFLLSGEN